MCVFNMYGKGGRWRCSSNLHGVLCLQSSTCRLHPSFLSLCPHMRAAPLTLCFIIPLVFKDMLLASEDGSNRGPSGDLRVTSMIEGSLNGPPSLSTSSQWVSQNDKNDCLRLSPSFLRLRTSLTTASTFFSLDDGYLWQARWAAVWHRGRLDA